LDQVRHLARAKQLGYRTEKAYAYWIERFIRFHGIKHPNSMGTAEVETFLTELAVKGRVAASTQNQAVGAVFSRRRVPCFRGISETASPLPRRARAKACVATVASAADRNLVLQGTHAFAAGHVLEDKTHR
jgi:hypothetical protein